MTEHEQQRQQPWTEKFIVDELKKSDPPAPEHPVITRSYAVGFCVEMSRAWQADHDQLVTSNEQMATQLGSLARQRDEALIKLDAAEQRVKELEGWENVGEEPIEVSNVQFGLDLHLWANQISFEVNIGYDIREVIVELPDEIRIQRRKEADNE